MRCETCDKEFPDSAVKVWNAKKVCPVCFRTLNGVQSEERPSPPGPEYRAPVEKFPVDPGSIRGNFVQQQIGSAQLAGLGDAVMTAAADLGISLSRDQVLRILANNNFPEYTKVATPLTPEERAVAVEVKYRWWKNRRDRLPKGSTQISDTKLREMAVHEVESAEIGRATGAGQLAHKAGCVVVLALVSVCSMMATAVLVGLMIVRGH